MPKPEWVDAIPYSSFELERVAAESTLDGAMQRVEDAMSRLVHELAPSGDTLLYFGLVSREMQVLRALVAPERAFPNADEVDEGVKALKRLI